MWAYAALAGAQLLGGYQQADNIRQSAAVQKSISDMNDRFIDLDSFNATKSGYTKAAKQTSAIDDVVGRQRVAFAGSNVDVNYGSAAAVQGDSKIAGMLNILELQRQGQEQARGYQVQKINNDLGSEMKTLQANMDASSVIDRGFTSALSTGISGYTRMQSTGVGQQKLSGSNSTPQWRQNGSTGAINGGPAWFFGDNPSRFAQPSMGSEFNKSDRSLFSDSNWGF